MINDTQRLRHQGQSVATGVKTVQGQLRTSKGRQSELDGKGNHREAA